MAEKIIWSLIYIAVFIWSAVSPADRLTWWLEVSPAMIGFPLALYFKCKKHMSSTLFWVILVEAVLLMVGGKYTYAEVPFFEELSSRNNYDKLAHFFQGVTPALIAREVFIRTNAMKRCWLMFVCVSISLAFSAFYELLEMAGGLIWGGAADKFLGTQGYVWDTQTDMLMALLGGIIGYLLLKGFQDKEINKIIEEER